jgi:DNA-binding NarL/FixJ family response regulator
MKQSKKNNTVLVDDCLLFREGIKLILDKKSNLTIAGEVSDLENLNFILDSTEINLIVISLLLPHKSVIDICKNLSKNYPNIPFLILPVGPLEYTVLECVINGARGIIWKDSTSGQLLEAIDTILAGDRYLNIPEALITKQVIQHAYHDHLGEHNFDELTNREKEVLKHFAKGLSYKEIGYSLGISPRTVESHKNNILAKLDLSSVNEMIKYAIKHSLIEL